MASLQEPPIQTKDTSSAATESLPSTDRRVHIIGAGRHVIRRHAVAAEQREVLDIGCSLDLWTEN